jgi:hypothetical protein
MKMKKKNIILASITGLAFLSLLGLSGCTGNPSPNTPAPAPARDTNANSTPRPVTRAAPEPDKDWDLAVLDTARAVDYLTDTEKDVILELNKARSNPGKYAELYIKPRLAWFDSSGKTYKAPGQSVTMLTSEGRQGVESCIADLARRESTPPLVPREGLSRAAKDHVLDTGPKGITGHTGTDGSSMGQRLNRYGQWNGGAGENISYGQNTGREVILQLLIDDGVSSRGHRDNNLNKNFAYVGVGIGNHSGYRTMCVLDFANQYLTQGNAAEQAEEAKRQEARLVEEAKRREERFAAEAKQRAANWDIAGLDAARGLPYLSPVEKELVLELNMVRSDPKKYARLYIADTNSKAYTTLSLADSLPPISLERGLCLAAEADGDIFNNANRYGKWSGSMSSASVMGSYQTGREIALAFLKSFGDKMVSANNKHIGIAVMDDPKWGTRTVFAFASGYTSNAGQ